MAGTYAPVVHACCVICVDCCHYTDCKEVELNFLLFFSFSFLFLFLFPLYSSLFSRLSTHDSELMRNALDFNGYDKKPFDVFIVLIIKNIFSF